MQPIARRLGTQTAWVALGQVFTLLIGLPLQVYVSRTLGPAELGIFGLLDTLVGTVAGLLGLGIAQTTLRFLPLHLSRGEYRLAHCLVWRGGLLLLGIGTVSYAALLASLPLFESWWPALTAPYHVEFIVIALMVPISLVAFFLQQSLRGFLEIRHLVLGTSIIQIVLKAGLVVLLFSLGLRLDGYILATVLGAAGGALWMCLGLRRKLAGLPIGAGGGSSIDEWRSFALVNYATALIGAATAGLDKYLLGAWVGTAAVGIFLIILQLQQLPGTFNRMFLLAGNPLFAELGGASELATRQHLYGVMTDWTVRAATPLILFLLVFADPVLALYGPQFAAEGTLPLRILLAAEWFNLLCGPTGNIAIMSGLERPMFRLSLWLTAASGAVLFVLVYRFGLVGAALGAAMAIVAVNIGTLTAVRRRLGLRWWNSRFAAWPAISGAALVAGLALASVPDRFGAAGLAVALAAMYLASIGATLLHGLGQDDRDLLRHLRDQLRARGQA